MSAYFGFLALALAASSAAPEAAKVEPMKFERVVGADPKCAPNCPEWIAAQGKIEVGTAAAFQKAVAALGGRRLPILISSPGGSTNDAIAMARLIRAKRLAVAVASTTVTPCGEKNPAVCGPATGVADALRAYCASACTIVLAGGVERFAYPLTPIGVHQTLTVLTQTRVVRQYRITYRIYNGVKEEISREQIGETRSKTTSKTAAMPQTESTVAALFREAGVGPEIEQIALSTPPSGVRWLTADEKASTHLVTDWINQRAPILGGYQANGLTGVATTASSTANPVFNAHGEWPFALPAYGRTVMLSAEFLYRRGGGVVQTIVHTRAQDGPPATDEPGDIRGLGFSFATQPSGGEIRVAKTFNRRAWRTLAPRADFCKLFTAKTLAVTMYDDPANELPFADDNPRQPPIVIETAKLDGMAALVDEACGPAPQRGRAPGKS